MAVQSTSELMTKKCQPCEGGVEAVSAEERPNNWRLLPGWKLSSDAQKIRKEWTLKNFMAGIKFFDEIARVAEEDIITRTSISRVIATWRSNYIRTRLGVSARTTSSSRPRSTRFRSMGKSQQRNKAALLAGEMRDHSLSLVFETL